MTIHDGRPRSHAPPCRLQRLLWCGSQGSTSPIHVSHPPTPTSTPNIPSPGITPRVSPRLSFRSELSWQLTHPPTTFGAPQYLLPSPLLSSDLAPSVSPSPLRSPHTLHVPLSSPSRLRCQERFDRVSHSAKGRRIMVASRAFALDVTQPGAAVSLDQDWQALSQAVTAFTVHAAAELGFTSGGLLQWLAVIAAM